MFLVFHFLLLSRFSSSLKPLGHGSSDNFLTVAGLVPLQIQYPVELLPTVTALAIFFAHLPVHPVHVIPVDAPGREAHIAQGAQERSFPGVVPHVVLKGALTFELPDRIGAQLASVAPNVLVYGFDVVLLYVLGFELRQADVTLEGPFPGVHRKMRDPSVPSGKFLAAHHAAIFLQVMTTGACVGHR